jgi:hypothetical protein
MPHLIPSPHIQARINAVPAESPHFELADSAAITSVLNRNSQTGDTFLVC